MTIDELISKIEARIKQTETLCGNNKTYTGHTADKIALAALQAHKQGYRMFTYDYSERDWLPAECELNEILKGLE